MTDQLKKIDIYSINDNTFKLIADDWFLLSAGGIDKFNMMTASWGGFGELWHKKVCFTFVRPQRFTYQFMEENDSFTLNFFDENYRDALNFCGIESGRKVDKAKKTRLTPVVGESGAVYFEEARLVIECRKLYYHDLKPDNFLVDAIKKEYPKEDYHRMYIGEIVNCLSR